MKREQEGLYFVSIRTKDGQVFRAWKRAYPRDMLKIAGNILARAKSVEYQRIA